MVARLMLLIVLMVSDLGYAQNWTPISDASDFPTTSAPCGKVGGSKSCLAVMGLTTNPSYIANCKSTGGCTLMYLGNGVYTFICSPKSPLATLEETRYFPKLDESKPILLSGTPDDPGVKQMSEFLRVCMISYSCKMRCKAGMPNPLVAECEADLNQVISKVVFSWVTPTDLPCIKAEQPVGQEQILNPYCNPDE